MHRPKLVIIGNGMACCRLLDELVQLAPGRHDIEVFGSEATGGYNRILLSPLVAGQLGPQDIELHTSEWYEEHGILRHCGEAIVEINRETRTLTSSKGRQVHYDQLVVATGSRARVPEIPGTDLSGVRVLRTLDDADALIGQTRDDSGKRFVVAGGGLLGLEAAWGLRQRGANRHQPDRNGYGGVSSDGRSGHEYLDFSGNRIDRRRRPLFNPHHGCRCFFAHRHPHIPCRPDASPHNARLRWA